MIVNVKTQEVLSSGNTADEAIVEEFSTIIPFDENSKNKSQNSLSRFPALMVNQKSYPNCKRSL